MFCLLMVWRFGHLGSQRWGRGTPTPVLNVYLMRVTLSLLKATLISLILFHLPTPPLELQEKGTGLVGTTAGGGGPPLAVSCPPPPHELLLIISLYPPHQKRSAPNQGEILGGWGSPSHPLKYIPHLQRQGAQEAEESGETKTRRGSDFRKHFCGAFHSAVWREAGSASLLGKADPDPATVAQFDCSLRPQGL